MAGLHSGLPELYPGELGALPCQLYPRPPKKEQQLRVPSRSAALFTLRVIVGGFCSEAANAAVGDARGQGWGEWTGVDHFAPG